MVEEHLRFTGVQVRITTSVPFDEVLDRLRLRVGQAPLSEIVAASRRAANEAEFTREVETRFLGDSGFMLFAEIDHGGWIARYGIRRRTLRWILGNPLIAITMIRQDIVSGLFVPIELLITERLDGIGTSLYYVRPSSLIALADNAELRTAAEALDWKFEALLARATTE